MDVPELLRAVRDLRGWSQAQLAAAGGTTRGAIGDYETGRTSPTVRTLNRVLAAAGLQIRAELEPLLAELDARVDAVLDVPPQLHADAQAGTVAALATLVTVLGEQPFAWGLDGETALRAHGFGFRHDWVQVALRFDDAAKAYFFRSRVRGTGGDPVSWFEAELRDAQAYLGALAFTPFGMVGVRLLAEEPATVRIEVAPGVVVPVLTVDEVRRGRPDLGDVLDRLRERRAQAERAVPHVA